MAEDRGLESLVVTENFGGSKERGVRSALAWGEEFLANVCADACVFGKFASLRPWFGD